MINSCNLYAVSNDKPVKRHYKEVAINKFQLGFNQDKYRVIESNAFRRLQYKTQVFVNFHGDHYRTRLTHSLEVSQIAIWVANGLSLNQNLAEVISLAHDLGHSPFGHAGEGSINRQIKKHDPGHTLFCHNAHTIKIITEIENRFAEFEGLNLSWRVLEGIAKHNGCYHNGNQIHPILTLYDQKFNLKLSQQPSLEAQIASIADNIAYNNHDIEDGTKDHLFTIDDLIEIDIIAKIHRDISMEYTAITQEQEIAEIKKRLTFLMVQDLISNSRNILKTYQISNIDDVSNFPKFLIQHSSKFTSHIKQISDFLHRNMYNHHKVKDMTNSADEVISVLFNYLMQFPDSIPQQFLSNYNSTISSVTDYIAGMTDRYAIEKFNKINK